ncbi:Uncharacterised protein [uncultured archaeon]|nr:Uncharacterised protein [uncultured archaeon]
MVIFSALALLLGTLQVAHATYGDITLTNPEMVTTTGQTLTSLHVGQQIAIQSVLTNHGLSEQNFTYLVQVLNSKGGTEHLEGTSASMVANQSFTEAQVWIPKDPGSYTVQVFVWQSLSSAIPLTNVIQTPITVEQ